MKERMNDDDDNPENDMHIRIKYTQTRRTDTTIETTICPYSLFFPLLPFLFLSMCRYILSLTFVQCKRIFNESISELRVCAHCAFSFIPFFQFRQTSARTRSIAAEAAVKGWFAMLFSLLSRTMVFFWFISSFFCLTAAAVTACFQSFHKTRINCLRIFRM